ncbi:glycosyltransferase family 8 protein [Pleomassaria siparia CBS 279.74]|uniref:Glycosyltransferase family 8 protein n=1 Tax=Pleomassaria siparia CBS 279.74 TaxID=1314801 RepID=A0A6G1KPM3_9PLEO|nr:glycosyltransferase family 8 protein [Pleomassaria siparia CBS 279.74]
MIKLFERRRFILLGCVFLFLFLGLLINHQTNALERLYSPEDAKFKHIERPTYVDATTNVTTKDKSKEEKLAYVIFLSDNGPQDDDLEDDLYVQAIRVLVWQLKHVPATRTKHDVVVMVAPGVSQSRRDRLNKDGAIIHPVELLHTKNDTWISIDVPRWDEVLTKLRIWQMTQYSRILMLDGDSMLLGCLDGVFDDPGAQLLQTKQVVDDYLPLPGEAPLPKTYLLASLSEVWDSSHEFPPKEGTGLKDVGMFNAGFFIMAPSLDVFHYYTSWLDIEGSFDPKFPEQNLMNKAHKWDGPMPWRELDYKWNIRYPTEFDFANGLVSMHEKWWEQKYIYGNDKVKQWLKGQRYEMKGWYAAMDAIQAGSNPNDM